MTGLGDAVIGRVDAELAAFVDRRARALAPAGPDLQPLLDAAREFLLSGGKRLRPTFAYWGWRTVRDETDDDRGLITAAASLELLHACALVHDDVMDASATRRGRPAAHAAFAAAHRVAGWPGDPDSYGTAAAIVLGDLLLSWADALFASAHLDERFAAHPRTVFDDMRELVMAGQFLDVFVQARGQFRAADALRVIEFKTSKYTIEGPLHFGAAIAGAPPEVFSTLSAYGLPLGEAFQLRDDLLGVFGDPSATGKPAGDDLREGKQTLLTALALQAATSGQAAVLRGRLGDRTLDAAGVSELREIIVATGALAEVERRITERACAARAALTGPAAHALNAPARTALDTLAGAAAHRAA
ncbi:MAG TPA: polyprenyl synthetase family protein [Jatrophihabitans sp.]|nr:polyprenyl synthetase family protein [Jatrophihabitans sp.]